MKNEDEKKLLADSNHVLSDTGSLNISPEWTPLAEDKIDLSKVLPVGAKIELENANITHKKIHFNLIGYHLIIEEHKGGDLDINIHRTDNEE